MVSSPLNKQTLDRFLLVLDVPPALKHLKTRTARTEKLLNLDSMQFTVFGSVVPDIDLDYSTERYAGNAMSIANHSKKSPTPITVNFTVDNNFNNYWFIYKWLDLICDDELALYNGKGQQQVLAGMPGIPYQTNLSIFALDEYQQAKTIRFDYTNAFPVGLAGFNWSHRDDGLITSSFTFAYSQFRAELLCEV
jgi:hypothetical protein